MSNMIHGLPVTLYARTKTGEDAFGASVFTETEITIENILIQPAAADAVTSEYELTGKHLAYVLHIPKEDANDWTDVRVKLPAPFSKTVKTYGDVMVYDPDLTPGKWNKQIKAEIYE